MAAECRRFKRSLSEASAGLVLDATTGDITGTPTTAAPATFYTITASNASGSASAIRLDGWTPEDIAIDRAVIAKEEQYLAERFGKPFEDYCARVRRWI